MTPINSKSFLALKAEIESYQRPCGYYMINLVDITDLRQSGCNEEEMIDTIFQYFDDTKWPPKEQRPQDQKWSDYIFNRETARQHIVESLVAGPSKGHVRPTMKAKVAMQFFDRFDSLFEEPKAYYLGMGLGSQEYTFNDGVAIVSATRAGSLCMVDGD